jgi:hypothetical protein
VSSAIAFGPAFASAVETVLVKWKTWKGKPYEAPARIDFRRSIASKHPRLWAHANTDFCIGLNHRDLNGVELQTMDPIRIAKDCVATIPEGGSGEISVLMLRPGFFLFCPPLPRTSTDALASHLVLGEGITSWL